MDTVFWTVADVLRATGGEMAGGPDALRFASVSIDSRTIGENDLFVAVKGETHDGHAFLEDVVAKGCRGIVLAREKKEAAAGFPETVVRVLVPDTIRALGDLAAFHRGRFSIPVTAITGSNGKTTTKEMTASVMARKFKTLKTEGNLNNHFGLPLTLFRLDGSHGAAVVELGMNHPGEILRLSAICRPDVGVITNINAAHLEGLGSVEAVMRAKGELIENIKPDGVIVLNADDAYCLCLAEASPRKVFRFGFSKDAEARGIAVVSKSDGTDFTLVLPSGTIPVALKSPGAFMVRNALAAAAVGYLNGLSLASIKAGLEIFVPVKGRMDIRKTPRGVSVIDGSYNANPGSMEAAVRTLAELKGHGRAILVAGDMLELGPESEHLHEALGRLAAVLGIDAIFHTGRFAAAVKKGAHAAGMAAAAVVAGDKPEVTAALMDFIRPGDWVLVKGSRGAGMEEIVAGLMTMDGPAA